MARFSGTLIVSDFDGTLRGVGGIPPRNIAAIQHFIDEGGIFTVATGRVLSTFQSPAADLPFNAPVILGNGSSLYDFSANKYLIKSEMASSALSDITLFLAHFPDVALEIYHGDNVYTYQENRFTRMHMDIVKASSVPRLPSDVPTPWSKIIVEDEYDNLVAAKRWLDENMSHNYEIIFSNPILLEITPKGATKGNMIQKLAQFLSIDKEHIYCIGDNENDLSMLPVCNRFFAPNDCAQIVKESSATIVCDCSGGALADVIDFLDNHNHPSNGWFALAL